MIKLKYRRHSVHGGKPGAWFSGHKQGQFRHRHKFFSYDAIQDILKRPPARNPVTPWVATNKDGKLATKDHDWCILTKQFRKALQKYNEGLTVAFNKADDKVSRRDNQAYMFCYIAHSNKGMAVARFDNGRSVQELSQDEICSLIAAKLKSKPSPVDIAVLQDAPLKNETSFIPITELQRGLMRFQEKTFAASEPK